MDNETFANYILSEKNWIKKMEIMYYLNKRGNIFFDTSVVFKTELLKLFLDNTNLDVDENMLITASLLCNCKKVDNFSDMNKVKTYAKEGADYLKTLGFDDRFCRICEQINRYSGSEPREPEADILELIDQFGGMLLDRPERIGFKPDEALVLLEHRNLKDKYNRYIHSFIDFIKELQQIQYRNNTEITPIEELVNLYRESEDEKKFITAVVYEFGPQIDELLEQRGGQEYAKNDKIQAKNNPNRPLFSEETTRKVMGHLE